MIRINLLPFRKARKIENIQRQVTIFAIILAVIMGAMLYYNSMLKSKINKLDTKVTEIKTEISRVEKKARRVDNLKKALKTLNQKIEVIQNLETKRREAVQLLASMTEMVAEQPKLSAEKEAKDQKPYKRLWFTDLQANGDDIKIQGIAVDNKTVADFMTRLEFSNLYVDVNLLTLKQQKVKSMNLKSFEISCKKAPKKENENNKK